MEIKRDLPRSVKLSKLGPVMISTVLMTNGEAFETLVENPYGEILAITTKSLDEAIKTHEHYEGVYAHYDL